MIRALGILIAVGGTLAAQSEADVRKAVTRALAPIEHSTATFIKERPCFSCHHNGLSIPALRMAQARGFAVDADGLAAVEKQTFRDLSGPNSLDTAIQVATLNDPTPNDSMLLDAAEAAGFAPNLTTAVLARRISRWQREDGHWITSDFRPPHSSSLFTATATAVRALRAYMPEELRAETESRATKARKWLRSTPPASTEDAAFRLLGLVWAGAPAADLAPARDDLLAKRNPDGAWPQLSGYDSDAYSTGESLYALRLAGVPADDPAFRKGLKFLTSKQARNGTWHVRTRMLSPADVSPPYFPTGFPYGEDDEFLSYAGSCLAVMALLSSLPAPDAAPLAPAADEQPAWVRTALFGNAAELTALLDNGLDPNTKTGRGTTLLMMAALDPDKVRLLLARGADATPRAGGGIDALGIAAAHFGTSAAVEALLNAGAPPEPPEGVRVRRPPLVFASMAGDPANVKLLLAHGADASAEALSQAITFGNTEVVRALLEAGAPATVRDRVGVNLLHWATITDRAAVIPLLAQAGADVDAQDDFGFTPLMYAATIDFGDTAALHALLEAGADRTIEDFDGKTARQHALRWKHAPQEVALR